MAVKILDDTITFEAFMDHEDAGFEDDISQMHGILRSGDPINMQDFYSWFGAWEDGNRFEKMLSVLLKNRDTAERNFINCY